jgi:acyl-CoA synthetase (NDP forming)
MQRCFATLLGDPGAALGAVVHDRVAGGGIHDSYLDYLRAAHGATGKPVFLVANAQGTGTDPQVVAATREGFPVLDGVPAFLRGTRCLLDYRDHLARRELPITAPPTEALEAWRTRLETGTALDEHAGMTMLSDLGLPAHPGRVVENEFAALAAARDIGFPVALKTAMGHQHKTGLGGVKLNLGDESAVRAAYADLAQRLGKRALVAPMVTTPGVELLLGMIHDAQFGPVVLLGFGGIHVEALADVTYALPPFDTATARRLLESLRLRALLTSRRHAQPLAIEDFCAVASRFSAVVAALGDALEEMDLNPVIVHGTGCRIVDALVVPRATLSRAAPGARYG